MFQQNRVGITGTELELEEGASGRFTPISDSGAHDADQFPLAPATYDEPRAEAEMKRSTEALVRDDDAEDGDNDVTPRERKKRKKSKKKRRSDAEMTLVADGDDVTAPTAGELPPLRTRPSVEPHEETAFPRQPELPRIQPQHHEQPYASERRVEHRSVPAPQKQAPPPKQEHEVLFQGIHLLTSFRKHHATLRASRGRAARFKAAAFSGQSRRQLCAQFLLTLKRL